jgi:hypothetical protein
VHLQTLIAAEPLQLQWGFLQLQARFCNCSRALHGCNCGLQTRQIFRCIFNGAAALQFLASANLLQVLQLCCSPANSDSIHYEFIYSLPELLRDIHQTRAPYVTMWGGQMTYHGQSQELRAPRKP